MSMAYAWSKSLLDPGFQCLHMSVVAPEHIDRMGHMNVRIYGLYGLTGARELGDRLGLGDSRQRGPVIAFTDLYTRHYREQFAGARLEVWGGVLEVDREGLRVYSELVNPERGELAATFVHMMQLQDRRTHAPIPFAPEVVERIEDAVVPWPEHGRSRSVDLALRPPPLTLAEARARGLDWLKPRVIGEDECDANGFYKTESFLELVWSGERIRKPKTENWLRDLGGGRMMGWATMESRGSLADAPRAGMHIQSFCAVVELGRTSQHERYWVYDVDRESLLCTASEVSVAFDIGERKAIKIPARQQSRLKRMLQPDLR